MILEHSLIMSFTETRKIL